MRPFDRRHRERPRRYVMRDRLASIPDDSWIEDEQGRKTFKVDGRALRARRTLLLEDVAGNEVASIEERMLDVRDTAEIERNGREIARIHKRLVSPLRDRFDVELATGDHWCVQGNVLAHEYVIAGDAGRIADVSRKWFRVRDRYGIQVEPREDDALVLAVAVAIDGMRGS